MKNKLKGGIETIVATVIITGVVIALIVATVIPIAKDSDLKVEKQVEHETSEGDQGLQLKIWWVGWDGKEAHLQSCQTSKKKKSWTMGNSIPFCQPVIGEASQLSPINKFCCHLGSDTAFVI